MLEAKSLRKAAISPALVQNPSPGNLQSTRFALHVNEDESYCSAFIASGRNIYKLEISLEDSSISKGKESLLIPVPAKVIRSSLLKSCPHRSEIQSVVLAGTDSSSGNDCLILGSVDCYGHLFVSRLVTSDQDVDRITYSVLPRDNGVGEGSWAGLCFNPSQWYMAAVARSFCKSVDVYDQDIHLRSFSPLYYPAALSFVKSSFSTNEDSILAVAEGCQLSIWDLRVKENGGCIQRICGSVGDILYAVCGDSAGNIAVGGADRTVTVYDPRRWSALGRWVNCSKYEITGLAFSSLEPSHIYVQGVDYEVFCGKFKEKEKVLSFKGDSNWLGFSKCSNRDVVGGWTDSGSIFLADITTKENECSDMDLVGGWTDSDS
ncbi:hypothetical protein C5167_008591 [Papaver somniferum]|uniref:Transcription factor WD40-like family n=1 Tax=Papaver somniferum TaxID=3469 RepID=A0A4Y7JY41_PAPSO|nr:uncharacterized protein LOC113285537 [Papaver somniferum]RZC64901.1 hypothetical protein C5167_008591 [Papaver somniferum]